MPIEFFKYQGTGNDFVVIDNRSLFFPKNDTDLISQLCDRKFGVGADGLMLLENHSVHDFTMVYYNADGQLSSMCGNGGRCLVHFAKHLGLISNSTVFEAVDGLHEASIKENIVSLRMNDVDEIVKTNGHLFMDTGSPHHVEMVSELMDFDVYGKGKNIRNDVYGVEGANVNFVEKLNEKTFSVRTYERGVEDETLSCGTGVTAVAIAMNELGETLSEEIILDTPGGKLTVSFNKQENRYTNVYLTGPAEQVFKGNWG